MIWRGKRLPLGALKNLLFMNDKTLFLFETKNQGKFYSDLQRTFEIFASGFSASKNSS